jgi:drug/metabolite transporter (DMT)-like permease
MTVQSHWMGHDARTNLRYAAEMFGAAALLAATTTFARRVALPHDTPLYTAIQLAPVVPVWLIPWAMLRHYLRIDEFQRLQFLQAIALTAGVLAGVAWTLPFLRRAFGWDTAANGMWEVYFSVIYVVATVLVTVLRVRPR